MATAQTFKPCKGCGNDIPPSKHRYRRRFCSYDCYLGTIRTDYGHPACKRCGGSHGYRRVRGLCVGCWTVIKDTDEIHDYPCLIRSGAEVVEEWQMLSSYGLSKREAAAKLGMTFAAFDRALYRHAARQRVA